MASEKMGTINPDDYDLYFGEDIVEGYAKGKQIGIVYNADAFTLVVGNSGEVARVMSNDISVIITVDLLQTSASNDMFSDALKADRSTGNGVKTVSFKDGRGSSEGKGKNAWVKKYADWVGSDTAENRTWIIEVAHYKGIVGGNVQPGS